MELQGGEDDLERLIVIITFGDVLSITISKFSKLLERRKNVENQRKLQKEMPCGNVLLNKYESVNLIALRKMKQVIILYFIILIQIFININRQLSGKIRMT